MFFDIFLKMKKKKKTFAYIIRIYRSHALRKYIAVAALIYVSYGSLHERWLARYEK